LRRQPTPTWNLVALGWPMSVIQAGFHRLFELAPESV
jgi:hypothetical protein